eukprot:TRINITY_DN6802_c0_g1_i2.p1 TRINITY_DN6802_c0_g1~~TRINITY_DN6802_c0_g1_i2.p1  ORF type:complete len:153 (-),score=6.09 TRINITY_DN6802_c0_g1_i2:49-474(-)
MSVFLDRVHFEFLSDFHDCAWAFCFSFFLQICYCLVPCFLFVHPFNISLTKMSNDNFLGVGFGGILACHGTGTMTSFNGLLCHVRIVGGFMNDQVNTLDVIKRGIGISCISESQKFLSGLSGFKNVGGLDYGAVRKSHVLS